MANEYVTNARDEDKNPKTSGQLGGILYEPDNHFIFKKAENEVIIPSNAEEKNTFIVFGRDRLGDLPHGYGGKGFEKCSSIDIVVGRHSSKKASSDPEYLETVPLSRADENADGFQAEKTASVKKKINPSVGADASRIYLSQKTDIDVNFGIVAARTGVSKARAGIAIKSDDVRIIARNTLKLVTMKDELLSANDKNFPLTGVQLIANNDDSNMQAIPKGEQLIRFILELQDNLESLSGIVGAFMEIQRDFNAEVCNHTHRSQFWALPTTPALYSDTVTPLSLIGKGTAAQMYFKVDQGIKNYITNLNTVVLKYTSGGPEYINSRYHFLN